MLLDEIPHATSHNLHDHHHHHHHRHRHGADDDDDGVFVMKRTHYGHGHVNGNGNAHDYGMYYDDGFKSPMSGFSLQSDDSSSSLFSMSPPSFDDLKSNVVSRSSCYPNNHNLYLNSRIPDSTVKLNETDRLVHEVGLCSNFTKMCIADNTHQNPNVLPFRDFVNNLHHMRGGGSGGGGDCGNFGRGFSDSVGFQSPVIRTRSSVTRAAEINSALSGLTQDYKMTNLFGSLQSSPRWHERDMVSQLNGFSGGSMDSPRRERQLMSNYNGSESVVPEIVGSLSGNSTVDAASLYAQKYGINLLEESGVSRLSNNSFCPNYKPCMSVQELLQYGLYQPNARIVPLSNSRIPRGNLDAMTSEGSFIIQGEGLNYVVSRGSDHSRCQRAVRENGFAKQLQRSEIDIRHHLGGYENPRSPRNGCSFPMLPKYNSLAEARGSLYLMAKDQHGCRFLQRMFDEGAPEDVQVIFSEIIDHVVELMMNPFGNYLMQKLLDVCDEEQRMQIILVVTQETGQLVRISLNTHGTRVVQKLIETLKTRQQISLVVSALQPGFLALIKDLNGNHVVQHCLQCLSNEDNKFIFVAAAKYCVDIATHQHGCCVLQRCIGHSSGKLRENLVAEISTNALLLAQDQYGNYVVQFILDLRIPSAAATLSLLFEGKYVHLSMQKFSSHVVEKCLVVFNDENRSRVIHELLSAPHFELLLQDPHANYVVQSALRHSEAIPTRLASLTTLCKDSKPKKYITKSRKLQKARGEENSARKLKLDSKEGSGKESPHSLVGALEENVWDGFGGSDDHTVTHAGDKLNKQFIIQGDSCKDSLHQLRGIRSSDYDNIYGTQGKEELYLESMTQKEKMLEKDSTPEVVFSSRVNDSSKEAKRLTSDDTGMSDHCFKSSNLDSGGCELCEDDTILGDKCVVEDDSVCQYSINHTSQADNELSFLDNDGWLDIGNFEDVDRMLSCDLTFGTGSLNNEEEFCWLSSSHGAEGSDDAVKSDFKFSYAEMSPLKSISDYKMDSKENIIGVSNDSNDRSSPVDEKFRSQMDVIDDGVPIPLSMFSKSETDMKSGNVVDLQPKEKPQRKLPKPSAGRRKNGYLENRGSVHPYIPPERYADTKQPFGASSSGVTSLDCIQKHKLNRDSNTLGCIQTQVPIRLPDYSHTPNHTSLFTTLSGSEHDGHLSPSVKESSYASNMESSHGHSLEAAALKTFENRENLFQCCDGPLLSSSLKNENIPNQIPLHSPGSAQQVGHRFENENEGHSEVQGVSLGFSPEIDSSIVHESSSMGSVLDQTSLEATSFCHLQQIMDQLDIKTKLCIRDSLYRLAKSAEQRHNNPSANGCIGDNEACKTMTVQDASSFVQVYRINGHGN
ncbi:unnamed protein product [Sphenostylis stenocarpa]|uniref:PUM-HD domain-containing protein n=1 Tax=Sphenostylis stenocarpa TaxID=92480 RepID=A0AA86TEM9_9FABA|nr:unnamed protein product [Sphenostylis stenocarpa]